VIDFSKIARPSFTGAGKKTDAAGDVGQVLPAPFRGKALRRRQVMAKEVRELLPHLPKQPGTATHCLLTGRADLMVLLVEMAEHYGGLCQHMRLATLSFNNRNTVEMAALLQAGKVRSLTLLCSAFFRAHNDAEYAEAKRQAATFPDRWRLAASRNHAKIVCLDFGKLKVVAEGSANLRCNGNAEQLMVMVDAGLHDWHAAWIDRTVSHEGTKEQEAVDE
jgi:hypothetical protein